MKSYAASSSLEAPVKAPNTVVSVTAIGGAGAGTYAGSVDPLSGASEVLVPLSALTPALKSRAFTDRRLRSMSAIFFVSFFFLARSSASWNAAPAERYWCCSERATASRESASIFSGSAFRAHSRKYVALS